MDWSRLLFRNESYFDEKEGGGWVGDRWPLPVISAPVDGPAELQATVRSEAR